MEVEKKLLPASCMHTGAAKIDEFRQCCAFSYMKVNFNQCQMKDKN